MKLFINVYDKNGTIKKQCEAQTIDIRFGTLRNLMKLVNIDEVNDTVGLMKTIDGAWNEIVEVLGEIFPEMEYEDWENVKLKDLIPTVIDVMKFAMMEIMGIPGTGKN